MRRVLSRSRGQVTVEVAVLFGVTVAAIVALANYVGRGMAGGLRQNADSLGTQYQADKDLNVFTRSVNIDEGGQTRSVQFTKTCQGLGAGTPMPAECKDAAAVDQVTPCPPDQDGKPVARVAGGNCP